MARTLFSRLYALVNLRENKVIANKMCFTVYNGKCPFYVWLADTVLLHTENDNIFTSFYYNAFQIHALNYAELCKWTAFTRLEIL